MKWDMLFLHAGGMNPEGLQGPYFPIGWLGLASWLNEKGVTVRIVNFFLEKIRQPEKSIRDLLQEYQASVIGIDLHWFIHSFEAIKLARNYRAEFPETRIILGGLTASHYDREILENFPEIDAVIRGDAELPLQEYLAQVISNGEINLASIPNLTYRSSEGEIMQNPLEYRISQEELDRMAFGRVLILRSPTVIARDILRINRLPVDTVYIPHSPLITDGEFHHQLLDEIENQLKECGEVLRIGFLFEDSPFRIDLKVIDRYLRLFCRHLSCVRIYLADIEETASRWNNFPVNFTETLRLVQFLSGKVPIMVGVIIGLPGQTRESTRQMAEWIRKAKEMKATVLFFNTEMHPGSELNLNSAQYGIKPELKSFSDYYQFLRYKKDKGMTYGYRTENNITLEEQREILSQALSIPYENHRPE